MEKFKKLLGQMASMRTGLILLGITAAFLTVGTLLVPDSYSDSLLFKALLGLLLLNMSICTANQFRLFSKSLIKKRAGFRTFALFILHAGVVLTLLGGILGGFYGFKAKFALFEGDSLDLSQLSGERLPYTFCLDKFAISYYDDGTASQFRSDFHLLSSTSDAIAGSAQVNHPFRVDGVKLYYAEYMYGLRVETATSDEMTGEKMLGAGEYVPLPDTDVQIQIVRYCPDYNPQNWDTNPSLIPGNEAVVYNVYQDGREPSLMVAPLGQWVRVDADSYMRFAEMKPYVVFMMKSDPGLTLAAFGSVLLMLGTCLLVINRRNRDGNNDTPERTAGNDPVRGGGDLLPGGQES